MEEPDSLPRRLFHVRKPFYPYVTSYMTSLIGHAALDSRGFSLHMGAWRREQERTEPLHPAIGGLLAADPGLPVSHLKLRSEQYGNNADLSVDEVALQVFQDRGFLLPHTVLAAGILLVMAWETTHPFHDHGPLWEFLRHCRNAVAHGGRFRFQNNHPRHPAEWGRFRIDRALAGTPLFRVHSTTGLLGPGDPLFLLLDIEQAYPDMMAPAPP